MALHSSVGQISHRTSVWHVATVEIVTSFRNGWLSPSQFWLSRFLSVTILTH